MNYVMVFGAFDILHNGHFNFFEQARRKGDYLIAVLARDVNIKKIKGNLPEHSEKARQYFIKRLSTVDKVILGNINDRYAVIKKYKPNVICLGYDQQVNLKELKNKIKDFKLKIKIFRLRPFRPDIYKSSKLKKIK